MARSILPSKSRREARARKTKIKRDHRRRISSELAQIATDPKLYDDLSPDVAYYPNHRIRRVVRDRREADKLNHFEHWAVRKTRQLPKPDRLPYMRSLLPVGLIGDHAMSHLRDLPELDNDEFRWGWWREGEPSWADEQAEMMRRLHYVCDHTRLLKSLNRQLELAHVVATLEVAIDRRRFSVWQPATRTFELVGAIETAMKRFGPRVPPRLDGADGIDDFFANVVRANRSYYLPKEEFGRYHPEWMKSLKSFLKGLSL